MEDANKNDASHNFKVNKWQRSNSNTESGGNRNSWKSRKSQGFEDRPPFNRDNRPQFNRGNKQNFNRDNKPFNRGNRAPFNRGNRSFNKGNDRFSNQQNDGQGSQNFRGPKNFNRRDFNNADDRPNFNQGNNKKPWQQGKKFQSNDENSAANIHKKFDDNIAAEVHENNDSNSENEEDTVANVKTDPGTYNSESESSESEEEVETQTNNMKNESKTSDSEDEDERMTSNKVDEVETSASDEVEVNASKDETETSSSEDDIQAQVDIERSEEKLEIPEHENEAGAKVVEQPNGSINDEMNAANLSHLMDPAAWKERLARTIYVSNIPPTISKEHLEQFFGKYGKIEEVTMHGSAPPLKFNMKLRKYYFIVFENHEAALKALEVNGMEYKDHRFQVHMRSDTGAARYSNEIYVGNLPPDADSNYVWGIFETCGIVEAVCLLKNKHSAFVSFESADSIELAVAMDKTVIKGHQIHVKQKQISAENMKRSMQPRRPLNVQRQPGPSIQIHKDKFDSNSITITLGNGGFGGPKVGQKRQVHRVRSGFVGKRW